MKKKLYSYEIITMATIMSITAIVSCGSEINDEQSKMDGITRDMIKTTLSIIPDSSVPPLTINQPV